MFFNNKIASYKEDTDIDFYPPVTTPPHSNHFLGNTEL